MLGFKETISLKKKFLADLLEIPLSELAEQCCQNWSSDENITALLSDKIQEVPHCHLLYTLNTDNIQLSAEVMQTKVTTVWQGKDLSNRPYLTGNLPYRGLILSNAYISQYSMQPCITAIQAVHQCDQLLGFIAADFLLRDLPASHLPKTTTTPLWQQYRGDPSIRSTVFMQQRSTSYLDENIDELNKILCTLAQEHGIFHFKIHFSSSRCKLWSLDDPYSYQLHSIEELMNPELFLLYPRIDYSEKTRNVADNIPLILEQFKVLRRIDETLYLRSGSLNIINNMIELTFSCDGTHYMSTDEFIEKDFNFWLAEPLTPTSTLSM